MQEAENPRLVRLREVLDTWARDGRADRRAREKEPAARLAFARLSLPPDGWYLDVGCGNGSTVRWAAEAMPDGWAVGIDLCPALVETARRASVSLPNVEFHAGAFPGTPLPHGCFDAVLSAEVLAYLPDLDRALHEIAGLLVPEGQFACLVDYYAENQDCHPWPEQLGLEMTLLDAAGWRGAIEEAGLEVMAQERLRMPPGPGRAPWQAIEGSLLTLCRRPPE